MTPIKAVLFDWGETLVRIPGMIHSPERHLGCLERLFEEWGGTAPRACATWACRGRSCVPPNQGLPQAHGAFRDDAARAPFRGPLCNNIKTLGNRTIARDGCAVAMGESVRRIDCARCGNGGRGRRSH